MYKIRLEPWGAPDGFDRYKCRYIVIRLHDGAKFPLSAFAKKLGIDKQEIIKLMADWPFGDYQERFQELIRFKIDQRNGLDPGQLSLEDERPEESIIMEL